MSELSVAAALPTVSYDDQRFAFEEASDPWREALKTLLASLNV